MQREHVPPSYRGDAFNCPHCGAYANQRWYVHSLHFSPEESKWFADEDMDPSQVSAICDRCGKQSYWYEQKMLYPDTGAAPLPHLDMPDNVTREYMEARDIMNRSPRGAAAARAQRFSMTTTLRRTASLMSSALYTRAH